MAEPMMKANGARRVRYKVSFRWLCHGHGAEPVQRCGPHFPPWGTRMWRIAQRLEELL